MAPKKPQASKPEDVTQPAPAPDDSTTVDANAEARIAEEKALSEKAAAEAKAAEEKAAAEASAAQEQQDKEWAALRAKAVLTLMKCGFTHEQAVEQAEEAKLKLHAMTEAEREEFFAWTIREYEEGKKREAEKAAASDVAPPAEASKRYYSTSYVRVGEERLEIGTCLDPHFSKEQLDQFVAEGHAERR